MIARPLPTASDQGTRRNPVRLKLHWQILIAMVIGAAFAGYFGEVQWVNRLAEIFMRLLKRVEPDWDCERLAAER